MSGNVSTERVLMAGATGGLSELYNEPKARMKEKAKDSASKARLSQAQAVAAGEVEAEKRRRSLLTKRGRSSTILGKGNILGAESIL